jgi:outer membrane protein TolC
MPFRRVLPVVFLLASACAVGPSYETPVVPVPDQWQAAVEKELEAEEPEIARWWESLEDPVLTDLIRRAELANLDLRISVARVAESRARRGIVKGDLYPNLVLDGAYSYTKIADNSPLGQIISGGESNDPIDQWQYQGSTFWELDLWGRVRRSVESATAAFEASIEDYRDVQVSLYAEVASTPA